MRHLTSWSVMEDFADIPGEGSLADRLSAMGIGGLELFTLFDGISAYYQVPEVVSVHLPYAIDWHSSWEGRSYEGAEGEDVRFLSFGHTRGEMEANLRRAIDEATAVKPAYGVLHAGNTDLRQVMSRKHKSDDLKVISDFADFVNEAVVPYYREGEPPFRLAFENLWWEGLKLRSPSEWRVLEDRLEFDNWGFTLDTGHLMNTCDGAYDEDGAIDEVMKIVDGYPKDMRDRIVNMHLQLSTTAAYRETMDDTPRGKDESWKDFTKRSYGRAGSIDQHRPFSSKRVNEIVDAVRPDFLTHELMGGLSKDRWGDVRQQRSLFD